MKTFEINIRVTLSPKVSLTALVEKISKILNRLPEGSFKVSAVCERGGEKKDEVTNRWKLVADRFRREDALQGKSGEVNHLVRSFRDGFSF
ncbi:hypothetical protein ACQZV8_08940 [Magnetococcales bacterium HHB-1]